MGIRAIDLRTFLFCALKTAMRSRPGYAVWKEMEALDDAIATAAGAEQGLTAQAWRNQLNIMPPEHVFGEETTRAFRIFERYCREHLPARGLPPVLH